MTYDDIGIPIVQGADMPLAIRRCTMTVCALLVATAANADRATLIRPNTAIAGSTFSAS